MRIPSLLYRLKYFHWRVQWSLAQHVVFYVYYPIQYIVQNMFFKNSIYIYSFVLKPTNKKHVVFHSTYVSLNGLNKRHCFRLPSGGKGSQRATALQLFRAMQSTDMKPDSWPRWWTVPHSTWVFPKIGVFPPKWMVYNGKPNENGMIWGYHYFWKHPHRFLSRNISFQSGIIIHFYRVQL